MCIFLCSDSLIITNFRQIFDFLYLQFNGALVCRDDCATKSEKSERQVEKDPSSFDLSVFTYDFQFAKWNDHQVNRMLATTSIERLPSQTFKRKHFEALVCTNSLLHHKIGVVNCASKVHFGVIEISARQSAKAKRIGIFLYFSVAV